MAKHSKNAVIQMISCRCLEFQKLIASRPPEAAAVTISNMVAVATKESMFFCPGSLYFIFFIFSFPKFKCTFLTMAF